MKKHIVLSLALLASGAAQAHVHAHSLQNAIAAIEKSVLRGPTNSQLVAAMTALQVALEDLKDTHGNLVALKNNLAAVSTAVDAGIKDLDEEIKALATIVGAEEAAVTQPVTVAPVVEAAQPSPAPTTLPTVSPAHPDDEEEDEHENAQH